MLPMSRGESFLENRVFADPDEVQLGPTSTCRPAATSSSTPTAASSTRRASAAIAYDDRSASSPAASPTSARRRGRAACGCSTRRPARRTSANTTTSSTAPASTCWRSCASLFPAELRDGDRAPGRRALGHARAGPRCRSAAPSSSRACTPRLQIPGLGGLSQGPGFANLGGLGLARQPRPAATSAGALRPAAACRCGEFEI